MRWITGIAARHPASGTAFRQAVHMRRSGRMLLLALGACLLCGLFGCSAAPAPAAHTLSEVTAVSISCGAMDQSASYSFWARREADGWLLDAACFTQQNEVETSFENRSLTDAEVESLFAILEQTQALAAAQQVKKLPVSAADAESYSFCLTLSDGTQYLTGDRQAALEAYFYRLAEAHVAEQ